MKAKEFKETAERLCDASQYQDAIPLLISAVEAFPENQGLWIDLVLAARKCRQHEQGVEYAKRGIGYLPESIYLWLVLGMQLTAIDQLDEAEKAINTALSLNSDEEMGRTLNKMLGTVHLKRKNRLEKIEKNRLEEIEARENIEELEDWDDEADSTDLNKLGIAHHNLKQFAKALDCYQRSAAMQAAIAPLFNMGLVFNDPEVSQDADAADAYRRALALKPDYDRAKERLANTKLRLVPLAERARAAAVGLVQPDDRFRFYVSPFEVLQIHEIESAEGLDSKVIQRAKKRLLQELDLNDGRISWLHDYPLDKSRALAMEDELYDESMRRYHWAIFQNKRLLRFLALGDIEAGGGSVFSNTTSLTVSAMKSPIEHFLYSDAYFPQETIELFEKDPGFRSFIGKPFAQQYNLILTRALERKLIPVIEILFDGRRWVEREHDDICFDGASRWAKEKTEWIEQKVRTAGQKKPNVLEVEKYLADNAIVEVFNLLPTWFRGEQSGFVAAMRSLAIACHNDHGDTDSSAKLLLLSDTFQFKSVGLNKQLEEDRAKVNEILAERTQHSFSLYVRKDLPLTIDYKGVTYGDTTITSDELESVRWGVFVRTVNGIEREHVFKLVLRSDSAVVPVEWNRPGLIAATKSLFRKAGDIVPVAEMPSQRQEALFNKTIDAVHHSLVPRLVDKLVDRLMRGHRIAIGPCMLSRSGITFSTGTIFRKEHLIPWSEVSCQMGHGQVSVRDKHILRISMPIMETDNAVLLPIISEMMED